MARIQITKEGKPMKTYAFKVVLEPDEDFDGHAAGWHAYCPDLVEQGASTWGQTREEALASLREVLEMTLDSMIEHGEAIPVEPIRENERLESEVLVTV